MRRRGLVVTRGLMTTRGLVMIAVVPVLCLGAVGTVNEARAQPSREPASGPSTAVAQILADAQRALDQGAYQQVVDQVKPVLQFPSTRPSSGADSCAQVPPDRDASDIAEAWRLYGLALFYLAHYEPARIAFLQYLELDVDAGLDPSLVPPEVVAFFEDVRARNAAELRRCRPKPRRRRSWALNLVPPAGQFQNDQRTKGWILAGVGSTALISNVGSYLLLRSWCDAKTLVCSANGEPRDGEARVLRTVNLASGAVFLGALAYGVIDGFVNYRAGRRSGDRAGDQASDKASASRWSATRRSVIMTPTLDGVGIMVHARF